MLLPLRALVANKQSSSDGHRVLHFSSLAEASIHAKSRQHYSMQEKDLQSSRLDVSMDWHWIDSDKSQSPTLVLTSAEPAKSQDRL